MAGTSDPRPYRRLSQEEFQKRVVESGTKCKPLDGYVRMFDNMRWQCGDYEDHIWLATPANVLRKNHATGCPYCAGQKILTGFNDLWTTDPNVANLLVDKEIGYTITQYSHCRLDFKCPNCGNIIKNHLLKDVVTFGLSCPCCSDGVSYPEKFVSNLLKQLGIDYLHNSATTWSNNKRYDYIVESLSLIIECHGEQHYNDKRQFSGGLDCQIKNDDYKRNLAIENNVKYYIEIDCRMSDMEFIKNSILRSELNNIFDLSNIDWMKCDSDSQKSNVIIAAELWNGGINSALEISKIMGLNRATIINYLNRMTKIGLCNYNGKEQMRLSMLKNTNNKHREVV